MSPYYCLVRDSQTCFSLDSLVSQTPKLRLVRLDSRQGLVRTRMAGIRAARAEVLTFLDSHIEATDGWLEPLLDRIARNYRTVASPVIETIDEKTFQYKFVTADLMGTFNWKLEFDWTQISEEQLAAREHKWAPYKLVVRTGIFKLKSSFTFSARPPWLEDCFLSANFGLRRLGFMMKVRADKIV